MDRENYDDEIGSKLLQRCFLLSAAISAAAIAIGSIIIAGSRASTEPSTQFMQMLARCDVPGAALGVVLMLINLNSWSKLGSALLRATARAAEKSKTELAADEAVPDLMPTTEHIETAKEGTPPIGKQFIEGLVLKLSAITLIVIYLWWFRDPAAPQRLRTMVLSIAAGFFGSFFLGVLLVALLRRGRP